jgi:predicted ATPase
VALYYVQRDGDHSTIRPISVERNGHIDSEEWPENFFEGSLRDSLLLAREQSKHRPTK